MKMSNLKQMIEKLQLTVDIQIELDALLLFWNLQ